MSNTADPITPREQALIDALRALVDLHHDWSRGSASITVRFETLNNAAIAQAKAALALTRS